jgi:hypothetical protein
MASIHVNDLRTLLAAMDEQEWRPIETAPRDGTIILIAINVRGDGPKVYEARWNETGGCFSSRNGFLLFDGAHAWRPLPAPPEPEEPQAPPHMAYLPAEPPKPEPAPEGQTVFGHISKRVSPSDSLPAPPVEKDNG